ncbi:MAG: slipin family protein [Elusimicrobia bacterium]|nr:slipin family protein [Elusimicrobiota bacterium]MDE2314472.1 slipin family protein [Elusimicrobiota bacterium]
MPMLAPLIVLVGLIVVSVKIVAEYDRLVIFVLGRIWKVGGPGPCVVVPVLMSAQRVTMRTLVLEVPPQDIITRDNVSIKVNAVVYFRVIDAQKAVLQVENYAYATSQIAQTTLRSVLGKMELDDLLANRDKINMELQQILDSHTEPWGVKVSNVEVKNVDIPADMQGAIAAQAEAERERRAKIIHAEGELQASEKLSQAAEVLSANPASMQLRYLQTLSEISTDKNTITVFPVPVDILSSFMDFVRTKKG